MPPWAGISCRCNQPGPVTAGNITGFIRSYTSLLFLVDLPDDAAARVLMEEGIPGPGSRIPVRWYSWKTVLRTGRVRSPPPEYRQHVPHGNV